MLNPSDPDYESQIAKLSATVYAFLRFRTRDPHAADDAVQQAFLYFATSRERVVDYAIAEAVGDVPLALWLVGRWLCTAANRALARLQRKNRRYVTGSEEPIDRECQPELGAAIDRDAARELVRQEIEELDWKAKFIVDGLLRGRPHTEIAAELGKSVNASMIDRTRTLAGLPRRERIAAANRIWVAASAGCYSNGDLDRSEPTQVAFADATGTTRNLRLDVQDLQWYADGHLRGMFVAPANTALPSETAAIALLRGAPGQDDVFAAAEPFVLLWRDGPEGRTASFSTYLGPRAGRPVPMALPSDAVQFVFAG